MTQSPMTNEYPMTNAQFSMADAQRIARVIGELVIGDWILGIPCASVIPFDSGAEHWQGRGTELSTMAELIGNLLVAQSGGPTAVINSSVAGVIQEAGKHNCIEEIYGGLNGILGILNEDLIDLNEEKARTIEGLKHTPAAALGTCRYRSEEHT